MRILTAALAVLAAACTPMAGAAPDPTAPVQTAPVQSADAGACAARGGEMRQVGRMQSWQCVLKYTDAGKRCTDGDDCRGDCRIQDVAAAPRAGAAAVGQCQASSDRFGCYTTVEGGKAEATICVD